MLRLCLLVMLLAAPSLAQPADPPDPAPPAPAPKPQPDPTRELWFEDARYSPALSDETVRSIAAHIRQKLLLPDASPPLLTRQAKDDFYPRIVIVSVSDGIHRARVVTGSARGVLKAANDALTQLRIKEDEKFEPRWVKVDVASTILLQEHADLTGILDYERSLFGLAFSRRTGVALSSEELVGSDAILQQAFDKVKLESYLAHREPAVPYKLDLENLEDVYLFRFSTQSWFGDGDELVPLYRGHRMWQVLKEEEVLASCVSACRYLTKAVSDRGQLAYLYQPTDGKVLDQYDWVAHFGAITALLEAHDTLEDADALAAAKRALELGKEVTGSWTKNGVRVACVIDRDRVALDANAMATLALATYVRIAADKTALDRLRLFAEALVQAQNEDGTFVHYEKYSENRAFGEESDTAPGLAVYALTQAHRVDPNPRWLDAAEKAARHLIAVRDKPVDDAKLSHDHWLMLGLASLNESRPAALYSDHLLRIARVIRQAQNRSPQYTDWLGSYFHLPNSTGTAVRNEGLCAAYAMMRKTDRQQEATATLEAIVLGAAYQFTCQTGPVEAMYFADPLRCLGAVKEGHSATLMRIDYTQQHLAAMLRVYRILKDEKIDAIRVPKAGSRTGGTLD